jgi:hypothetical protein
MRINHFIWGVWVTLILAIVIGWNVGTTTQQQFVYLAREFLNGHVYLSEIPGSTIDLITYKDNYFWHLGPLPAMVLVPVVWAFGWTNIGIVQLMVVGLIWIWGYEMARGSGKFRKSAAVKLAFGLVFGSILFPEVLTPKSWHFSQLVSVLFVGLYIREVLRDGSGWMAGLLLGLAGLTRANALIGITFGIYGVMINKKNWSLRVVWLTKMLVMIGLAMITLLWYNQVRFDSIWDTGYTKINSPYIGQELRNDLEKNGMFRLKYLWSNIVDYFFKLPEVYTNNRNEIVAPYVKIVDPGGVAVWFTFFWLIYIFQIDLKNRWVVGAGLTSVVMLLVLLSYYTSGGRQVGPRYLCDLLPYIYLILILSIKNKKLSIFFESLIILSGLVTWIMYELLGGM